MLNHIYGLVGIVGTLVTILTSFLKDDGVSQWLLVSSGWIAALVVGTIGQLTVRKLIRANTEQAKIHAKTLKDIQNSHRESIKGLIRASQDQRTEIIRLSAERDVLTQEKATLSNIAGFLVKNKGEVSALPRVKVEQDGTGE
ncbi:hypothetical protein [Burkholderia vietnamiensis]|uniref:hypothetical protein n=1 Tax=Burkholderia vietnamiensis TaxID=60552 RepID=UPI0012D99562|nr:hypothetical protein [Burkholderia vietnamiensis]